MIRVIKTVVQPPTYDEAEEICLFTRRETLMYGAYEEYSYVGPRAEVNALSKRICDSGVDAEKVDTLLRQGFSVEDALKELGVP